MPFQPFSRTANIDKLDRSISWQISTHIFTPMYGHTGELDSIVLPMLLVREGKPGYVGKTHPGQTDPRLLRRGRVIGNQ
jgi:hypothetical protein